MKIIGCRLIFFICMGFLTGCGSVVKHVQISEDFSKGEPYYFVLEDVTISAKKESKFLPVKVIPMLVKAHLVAELERKQLSADRGVNESNVIDVRVDIVDFRDRGNFNRLFWGALAGQDYLESDVVLIDQQTGKNLGTLQVRSECALVEGMEFVAKIHAQKIAQVLKRIATDEWNHGLYTTTN